MDGWIACHLKFEITHMKWNGKNEGNWCEKKHAWADLMCRIGTVVVQGCRPQFHFTLHHVIFVI